MPDRRPNAVLVDYYSRLWNHINKDALAMNHNFERNFSLLIIGDNPHVTINNLVKQNEIISYQNPRLPAHPIVGRGGHLAEMLRLAPRRVAIWGGPGMGKTALAAKFSMDNATRFDGGILWSSLGPQCDLRGIEQEILRLLGTLGTPPPKCDEGVPLKRLIAAFNSALVGKRILWVLDDVWSEDLVRMLEVGAPDLSMVLTTRLLPVADAFAGSNVLKVAELSRSDSLLLVSEIVPSLKDNDLKKRLYQASGGSPLALVILASQVRSFKQVKGAMAQVIECFINDVESALDATVLNPSSLQPPYLEEGVSISLRIAISVSWRYLSCEARHALSAASLLPPKPSSFEMEALTQMVEGDRVQELVESGLAENLGDGRMTIHQTVWDFASKQEKVGDSERARCFDYYLKVCERHATKSLAHLQRMDREVSNLRAVLCLGPADRDLAVRFAVAIANYMEIRGHYSWASDIFEAALQKLDAGFPGTATIYGRLGSIVEKSGNYDRAEKLYNSGLKIARKASDQEVEVYILQNKGVLASKRGEPTKCIRILKKALGLATKSEDPGRIAAIMKNLGAQTVRTGDFKNCEKWLKSSYEFAVDLDDESRLAGVMTNLGLFHIHQGNYQQAAECLDDALKIERKLGHRDKLGMVWTYKGILKVKLGDLKSARKAFEDGMKAISPMHRQRHTLLKIWLAYVDVEDGEIASAARLLDEAVADSQDLGNLENLTTGLWVSGRLAMKQAKWSEAVILLNSSIEAAEAGRFRPLEGFARRDLARVLVAQGRMDEAEAELVQADLRAKRMRHRELLGTIGFERALLCLARRQVSDACFVAKNSLATLQSIGHADVALVKEWEAEQCNWLKQ